jgi:hypothetical protein
MLGNLMGIDSKKTVPNPLAEKDAKRIHDEVTRKVPPAHSETTRKVPPAKLTGLDDPGAELGRGPMRARQISNPMLMELDEPTFSEVEEQAPVTKRPEYDADKHALHIESADDRATVPPSPTYEMLRDSCSTAVAEEVPLDEDQILRPSRKLKLKP